MKNNYVNFAGLSLAGMLSGYMLFLAFPPHEWLVFSFLALMIAYFVIRSSLPILFKLISFALMQFTFFFFYHEKSEWYLEIATRSQPTLYQYFKWAAIIQYSVGAILTFGIGIVFLNLKQLRSQKFLPAFTAIIFALQFFCSTSTNENSFLIPYFSSNLFKGSVLPFELYLVGMYGLYFHFLESIVRKTTKLAALSLAGLISFILLNNFLTPQMKPMTKNLVILSGESFNLDGRSKDDIKNHFAKFKVDPPSDHSTYIWPEAVVTYKKPDRGQQKIVKEVFSENFPGVHFYGAYAVKENVPGESTNRYFSFNTTHGKESYFNKAFPVPFQESSDYFWFIPENKIGLSFNVKSSKEFGSFKEHKNFSFYLCNEVTELKNILHQYNSETELILVPSNTPAQNTEYYENILDFYSRVLAKIKRTPLIKVSSHGHIYVIDNDQYQSFKRPVYVTGASN